MFILTALNWAAIAALAVICVLMAAIAVIALFILGEQALYRLSRRRTLRTLGKVEALQAEFARAIGKPGITNPLMRGFSLPLSRFDAAVKTLKQRAESLEDDNVARRGPYTRSEWRHLRRDVKAVLRRGRQLDHYRQAPDARDGIWPFAADYAAIYADDNYAGREPATTSAFAAGAEAFPRWQPTPRRSAHRNWAVNRGALDEDVMPSQEERRQAQAAAFADQPAVAVFRPAVPNAAEPGVYNRTGKVISLAERRNRINVKA